MNISSDESKQQEPEVELVATVALREKIRAYTHQKREHLRAQETDALRFGLGEIQGNIDGLENLTTKDVSGLATRIKRRKHATVEDMYRLSHAFLQGVENISTFSNIPGALPVLIKELTGKDAARQVSASECLCNLSLGEAPVCDKIANMAGSYLVTYLNSTEERLKRTSIWTLTNVLVTGGKGAQNLMQMELFVKLWQLYVAEGVEIPEDYREDAGVCLQVISCSSKKLLRENDFLFLKENLTGKNPTCIGGEFHLQILFHSEIVQPHCLLNEQQLKYLVSYALSNLQSCKDFATNENRLKIVYAVRMLSNLLAIHNDALNILLKQMTNLWHTDLVALLNKLFAFKSVYLAKEILWLLQNLLLLEEEGNANLQQQWLANLKIDREGVKERD